MSQINASKAVQSVTYVYGREACTLTDDALLQLITKKEAEIAALKSVNTELQYVKVKVAALQAEKAELAKLLDSRVQVAAEADSAS